MQPRETHHHAREHGIGGGRHLDYDAARLIADTDANLGHGGPSIRPQDFDVVLVRRGLAVSDVRSGNLAARFTADPGPAGTIATMRWNKVDTRPDQ
jgi:hypothetical protein